MNLSMQGKVVLITGGASGIGASIAQEFAQQGAEVIVADKSQANIDSISTFFTENGLSLDVRQCDVTVSAEVSSLMLGINDQFGKLDVLVNNVGDFLGTVKPFEKMTDDDIDNLFSINLRQLMICSRDAIPLLREAGAGSAIINISSIEGYRAMPNIAPYGAYKLGIEGFTKSLALELAPSGIRVNAIAPETTETEQVRPKDWIAKEDLERPNHWVPLGRFGLPSDIAGCALFLASELSAWVTGTVIHCDGGALAAAGWYRTPEGGWTNTPIVDRSGIPSMVQD
ncbi:MAG: SDR family NAD(P)-dependent oxidoreductase [Pseudomonadales bacterium]